MSRAMLGKEDVLVSDEESSSDVEQSHGRWSTLSLRMRMVVGTTMVVAVIGVVALSQGYARQAVTSASVVTAKVELAEDPLIKKYRNVDGVATPKAKYLLAASAPLRADTKLLEISGQLPVDGDGTLCETPAKQMDCSFANLHAALKAADMDWDNLMKMTVFLSDREHLGAYREARDRALGDKMVASNLIIVTMANPKAVVEIDGIAVK